MPRVQRCRGQHHKHYKDKSYYVSEADWIVIDGMRFSSSWLGFKGCPECNFRCITDDIRCECCTYLFQKHRRMNGIKKATRCEIERDISSYSIPRLLTICDIDTKVKRMERLPELVKRRFNEAAVITKSIETFNSLDNHDIAIITINPT
ncbi:MAG: hypothetical protein ACTHME_06235 [Candidatus Nitrosocosmicus sp.]